MSSSPVVVDGVVYVGSDDGKVHAIGTNQIPSDTGSIAVMKFNDSKGNGFKDPGDDGLADWMIVLKVPSGAIVSTTTAQGSYHSVASKQAPTRSVKSPKLDGPGQHR